MSWFTADGRTREHARAERARRAASREDATASVYHEDQDDEDADLITSAPFDDDTPIIIHFPPFNETLLSRQARASRTRVGPQVMRANRHRGGDRRKSTKTRKDSTKKTSPGNSTCRGAGACCGADLP